MLSFPHPFGGCSLQFPSASEDVRSPREDMQDAQADRNVSVINRNQRNPHERVVKATGVEVCQDAKHKQEPSILQVRHADSNEHGTAQDVFPGMAEHTSDIPRSLRLFNE